MASSAPQLVETAQAAADAGDWLTARRAFEELAAEQPGAEAFAGLGDVLWWLGETDDAVRYQERAYAAFRHREDFANSVMIAVGLYLIYRVSLGNTAAARGWLSRAGHLVTESHLVPLAGWVSLVRAHDSVDALAAERLATEAREIATRFGDRDLELCALSQLGTALVEQGRGADGAMLLDEAMAASLAGEATRPHTVVYASCNLITACAQSAEPAHAMQWIRAADDFEQRFGNPHLYTTCRAQEGVVLFAAGDWPGAEREFRAAQEIGVSAEPALCAEAAARLAELRLAQGRIEEAERLIEGFEDFETSTVTRAALAMVRGETGAARQIALRGVHAAQELPGPGSYRPGHSGVLDQVVLWEILARVCSPDEAGRAVAHLTELASRTDCEQLQARAWRADGRLRRDTASLERALGLFHRLGLPLQAARTRLLLAEQMSGDDAIAEARAALAVFTRLGAARGADAAAARLRELGVVASRGGPTGVGQLTRREREVLELLGEGLSNRELADRLFLSRKTVERHVRNVLYKLGLRNRAEAAAYVIRHATKKRSTD